MSKYKRRHRLDQAARTCLACGAFMIDRGTGLFRWERSGLPSPWCQGPPAAPVTKPE